MHEEVGLTRPSPATLGKEELTQFEVERELLGDTAHRRLDDCYTNEDLLAVVRPDAPEEQLSTVCDQRLATLVFGDASVSLLLQPRPFAAAGKCPA